MIKIFKLSGKEYKKICSRETPPETPEDMRLVYQVDRFPLWQLHVKLPWRLRRASSPEHPLKCHSVRSKCNFVRRYGGSKTEDVTWSRNLRMFM
jgi:hypothetical protein